MTKENLEQKISFQEYKRMATKEDVEKIKTKYKPKIWENIPLIGPTIYAIRLQFLTMGIDRGPLRQSIFKWGLIFMFAGLLYISLFFMLLTPYFLYFAYKIAISKTEIKIKENKL